MVWKKFGSGQWPRLEISEARNSIFARNLALGIGGRRIALQALSTAQRLVLPITVRRGIALHEPAGASAGFFHDQKPTNNRKKSLWDYSTPSSAQSPAKRQLPGQPIRSPVRSAPS
jgi:hypothetical protein